MVVNVSRPRVQPLWIPAFAGMTMFGAGMTMFGFAPPLSFGHFPRKRGKPSFSSEEFIREIREIDGNDVDVRISCRGSDV